MPDASGEIAPRLFSGPSHELKLENSLVSELEVAQERIHRLIRSGGLSAQMIRQCAEIARRTPGRAGARLPGQRSDTFAHPPGIEHGQRQRRENAPERRFFRRLSYGATQLALGLDFRLEKPLPRNPQRLGHVDQLVCVCHHSSRKGTAPPAGGFAVGDDARNGADETPHPSDQGSIVFADQLLQARAVTAAPDQPRPIS